MRCLYMYPKSQPKKMTSMPKEAAARIIVPKNIVYAACTHDKKKKKKGGDKYQIVAAWDLFLDFVSA